MLHIVIRFIGSFSDSSKRERIDVSGPPLTVNALPFSDTGLQTGALTGRLQREYWRSARHNLPTKRPQMCILNWFKMWNLFFNYITAC